MKNKNKTQKTRSTSPQRKLAHPTACPTASPRSPIPQAYFVVIELDPYAVARLRHHPIKTLRPCLGLANGQLTLVTTVTLAELGIICDWVYIMGPHVTLRSPAVLEDVAECYLPLHSNNAMAAFPA